MKSFFYFGVMSIMFSCSSFFSEKTDYESIADKITEKAAKKLKGERGLVLAGTGGQMMNDIQMMSMGFNFYKVVDIDAARQLLIDSVEEYLFEINANKEVRPYLHNYPFTAQNVEVVIYFYNPDGSKVPSDKITIAAAEQGKIIYYVDYPERYTIKSIHEETYENALKIVNARG